MSANPNPDLQQEKTTFESFSARRVGKERLLENLQAAAVALPDHYLFKVVRREQQIKPEYLRR